MKKLYCLVAALLGLGFAAAAAVLPAEKLLPDDTLVLFSIPDFSRACAIYTNSPQTQFWNDPAMRPFKDKFINKLKTEFITPLEHDLGIHFDDYTSLPQGQFTIALVQEGWQAGNDAAPPPTLVLLLDTRGKSAQLKSNLADLKKKWLDAGKTVKTEKIRDVEFSAITLSTNDIPKSLQKFANQDAADATANADAGAKSNDKQLIYLGQADSLFIMGSSPKTIERILAANSGGSVKTLGDVPAYSANYNSLFRDAPVYWWINAKAFVDMLKHSAESASSSDFPAGKLISAFGLTGLKSIAFSYKFSDDGASFNFLANVPESERTGLFKLLAGEPKDCNPPPFVPADAVKFQRWRIDGQKVWAGIRQMVGDAYPQGLGTMDFMVGSLEQAVRQKDPDFDIKKNLIGNLGDDVIFYQKAPKGGTLKDLNSAPALYLIGSPNPEQLAGTIKTLISSMGQANLNERDFRGRKIFSLPMPAAPSMGDDGSNSAPASLSFAFSGGYLAFSTDTPILEEFLRSSENQGKSLRDTSGLAAASQKISGAGTSLMGYSNEGETMRAFFNVLKKDPALNSLFDGVEPITAAMGIDTPNLKDWVDVSLLPDFNRVAKYFYFSVYSAGASPEGLFLKAFAPVPPQLKK